VTWVLVILVMAGVSLAAIFFARMQGALAQLASLGTDLASAKNAAASWEKTARANAEGSARLEAVVDGLKKEISTLETDLFACRDPLVVRDRLRKLLDPLSEATASVPPGSVVPR
jgi:hypothetical protein